MDQSRFAPITSGAGFSADAIPFNDMTEDGPSFIEKDGEIYLRGSRSKSSGSLAFPMRRVCLETGSRDMEPFLFGPRGTLYSYTTIHVSSSRPVPYTLGYVDFPNGVRVLADVRVGGENASLSCGQEVELRAIDDHWFVVPATFKHGSQE